MALICVVLSVIFVGYVYTASSNFSDLSTSLPSQKGKETSRLDYNTYSILIILRPELSLALAKTIPRLRELLTPRLRKLFHRHIPKWASSDFSQGIAGLAPV